MSMDDLIQLVKEKNNPTIAGLDPKLDFIPSFLIQEAFAEYGRTLKGAAEAIWQFNKGLIDALYEVVPAVKPQSAYYEMYGFEGVRVLAQTIDYAKSKGLFVVVDAKRNDIGTTASAYATAYLGRTDLGEGVSEQAFGADCVTVNPYLGTDGITPFLFMGKSIFVLAKTSNPSSGELQDKKIENVSVYELIGDLINRWGADSIGKNGYSDVGAVVGATYPSQLADLRKRLPATYFLVPGYGAQGGKAEDIAKGFDKNGLGAIINASRSIMCAYQKADCEEKDFALAAKAEAIRMRDEIISFL